MTEPEQETRKPERGSRKRLLSSGFSTIRDVLTFAGGVLFVGNEVFVASTAEPAIIAAGVAMMGLPLVFGADERKRGSRGEDT